MHFVSIKLQKVYVDTAKAGGWPQAYPTFIPELRQLCLSPQTYSIGLSMLSLVAVEFVSRPSYPILRNFKPELNLREPSLSRKPKPEKGTPLSSQRAPNNTHEPLTLLRLRFR